MWKLAMSAVGDVRPERGCIRERKLWDDHVTGRSVAGSASMALNGHLGGPWFAGD